MERVIFYLLDHNTAVNKPAIFFLLGSSVEHAPFGESVKSTKIRLSVFIVHSCHVLNIFSFFCGKTYYCLG